MGTVLVVLGVAAWVAAVAGGARAAVRLVRRRPARRAVATAGAALLGGLALVVAGGMSAGADSRSAVPAGGIGAAGSPGTSNATTDSTTTNTVATGPASAAPTTAGGAAPGWFASTAAAAGGGGSAAAALDRLAVKGRSAKTGYSRTRFGQAWADVDRNGCDTRNDVLRRDLREVATTSGTGGCQVASGTLPDPYSGSDIAFVRGRATSSAVQVDHVVALSNAWQTGAAGWDDAMRERLANDPLELLAVDGPLNEAKGDGDAATWLPPNRSFRCAYVARQVAVKTAYRLWVTPPEKAAVAGVLAGCPGQPLPAGGQAATPDRGSAAGTTGPSAPAPNVPAPTVRSTAPTAREQGSPAPAGPAPADPGNSVNCSHFTTQPEAQAWFDRYRPWYGDVAHLDADHDGLACQSLPG